MWLQMLQIFSIHFEPQFVNRSYCSIVLKIACDSLLILVSLCVEVVFNRGYGREVVLGVCPYTLVQLLGVRPYTNQDRVHRAISLKT